MPIGQAIAQAVVEVTGQIVMEVGGEVIRKRYGWKGCVVAILIPVALIALLVWHFRP